MGMEIPSPSLPPDATPLQSLPNIFLVGPPSVGKRSILKRLLAMGKVKGSTISTSGLTCQGWTIDTKYYTADVGIWMAHLGDYESNESAKAHALSEQCQALVLIFDLNNFSSFEVLQEWVSKVELQHFEILLCVGNKADRVPGHFGHTEYRRRLQKRGESSSDPHPEFRDYGIQQTDGSSLLSGEEESLDERRQSYVEWCMDHGIEYIEACAVDDVFDQCMSVDGDSQGLTRILGALSAHMWPGMIMKSEKVSEASPPSKPEDDSSDEDSEILIEYELLSNGSAEPWDGDEGPWSMYEGSPIETIVAGGVQEESAISNESREQLQEGISLAGSTQSVTAPNVTADGTRSDNRAESRDNLNVHNTLSHGSNNLTLSSGFIAGNGQPGNHVLEELSGPQDPGLTAQRQEDTYYANVAAQQQLHSSDLEQLMQEMARMRENSRLMPDSQRREMAARLALQMASMFDDEDD